MKNLQLLLAAGLVALGFSASAVGADWLTAPSYYTHEPIKGERVAQYSPIGPFYYLQRADFSRSGYRHYRSTIQAGGSADNLHIVEEWGRPVVPYEQWRFPFRPYGSPYDAWGPPYGGLNNNFIVPGYGGFPGGGFPGGFPGGGGNNLVVPRNQLPQQWQDGYWPSYDRNDRSGYYEPYPSMPPP